MLADEATRAAVAAASIEELDARLARLRASRDRLGPVNLRAEVEAGELEATVAETRAREAELQQALDRLRAGIGTLDGEARQRLLAAFEAVDGHFRRLFAVLFGGGKAHLRLAGADDPLQAGLELEASPPGKKLVQHLAAVGRREDADRAGAGLRLLPGAALALVRAGRGRRTSGRRQCRPVRGADAGDRPGDGHPVPGGHPPPADHGAHGPALWRHHGRARHLAAGVGGARAGAGAARYGIVPQKMWPP